MRMGTHSNPGCSRYPAASGFRTFSNRATGSYPVFSVKLKTGGKLRVVPCGTVWLCQWRKAELSLRTELPLSGRPAASATEREPFGRRVPSGFKLSDDPLLRVCRGGQIRVDSDAPSAVAAAPGALYLPVGLLGRYPRLPSRYLGC